MADDVARGTPESEPEAERSGAAEQPPRSSEEPLRPEREGLAAPPAEPVSAPSVSPEGEPAQPATGETPPSPFGDSAYFPPAAEQAAPEALVSDARVGAAMQQTSSDVPVQGASEPGNWWEQPVPSAAVPVMVPAEPQEVAATDQEANGEKVSFWRWLWEAAILVVLAFAIAFVIKVVIVQPFYIPSGSMEPTLLPGDRVLVNKFIYRFREPQAGDIVVFEAPRDAEKRDFIKRVVAVEGQTVEIKDGKVYVDTKLREEPYLATSQDHSSFGPVTLGENSVFVMGDNRTNSSDSRVFGPFGRDRILGEAFVIYWPFTRTRSL